MRSAPHITMGLVGWLVCGVAAQAVDELDRIREGYEQAVRERVEGPYQTQQDALRSHVLKLCNREIQRAQQTADLDLVIELRALQAAWETQAPPPEPTKPRAVQFKSYVEQKQEQLAQQRDTLLVPMVRQYLNKLEQLQPWLTQQGRVDDALAVRAHRQDFETQHATLMARVEAPQEERIPVHLKRAPGGRVKVWPVDDRPNPEPAFVRVPGQLGLVSQIRAPAMWLENYFIIAVRQDGTLGSWGAKNEKNAWAHSLPSAQELNDVVDVGVCEVWGVALRENGELFPLGTMKEETEQEILEAHSIVQIAAMLFNVLALDNQGVVHVIGTNKLSIPEAYQGKIQQVRARDRDAMFLLKDGKLGFAGTKGTTRLELTEGIEGVVLNFNPMILRFEGKNRMMAFRDGDDDWIKGVSNFASFPLDSHHRLPAAASEGGRWEVLHGAKPSWEEFGRFERNAKGCSQLLRIQDYIIGIELP